MHGVDANEIDAEIAGGDPVQAVPENLACETGTRQGSGTSIGDLAFRNETCVEACGYLQVHRALYAASARHANSVRAKFSKADCAEVSDHIGGEIARRVLHFV